MDERHWRRLPPADGSVAAELAAGEALLAGLAHQPRAALRWYRSRATALVLGAGQPLSDVDHDELRRQGFSLHRRASGGGAVLWTPALLMLDLVLPLDHPLALYDVSRSYEWLGRVWQQLLGDFGLAAELVSTPAARADRAQLTVSLQRVCFAGKSPAEVVISGRKLVGLAQLRRRHGFLFQVGIYRHWPAETVTSLLAGSDDRAAFREGLAARVTALDQLAIDVDDRQLQQAFERRLMIEYGVTAIDDDDWRADELRAAAAQTRFAAITLETGP